MTATHFITFCLVLVLPLAPASAGEALRGGAAAAIDQPRHTRAADMDRIVGSSASTDEMLRSLEAQIAADERLPSFADDEAFHTRRGTLVPPFTGAKVFGFGDDASTGRPTRGLGFRVGEASDVQAPADGWIAFAGEYRSYGPLIILRPATGYAIILAGPISPTVHTGDRVRSGERIGTLKPGHHGDIGYLEILESGVPVDPEAWMSNAPPR